MASNAAFAPPELPRKGIFCSSAYIFRQDGSQGRPQQQKGRSVAEPARKHLVEAREFARRRAAPRKRSGEPFSARRGRSRFCEPLFSAHWLATCNSKKAGPLPNLPGKFWWRRGESNGVCAARIRGACSAKRATGTFRGPRNAGGVRFSNTAVITKKQAGFPDLLGFFGGGAENRTPVHTRSPTGPYKLVQRFEFGCETPVGGLLCILAGSIFA